MEEIQEAVGYTIDENGKQRQIHVTIHKRQLRYPREPKQCDHAGQGWSDTISAQCRLCGAPLFLPPRHLAFRDAATLERMSEIWEEAGCPWFSSNEDRWIVNWAIYEHPLFQHVGGIPVQPGFSKLLLKWLLDNPDPLLGHPEGG